MFLLFEDEWGHVDPDRPARGVLHERHRPLARAEPLLLARGRLERSAVERVAGIEEVPPVVNVIVRELAPLEHFVRRPLPARRSLRRRRSIASAVWLKRSAEVGAGMRAVAPPVQSFAAGRRR